MAGRKHDQHLDDYRAWLQSFTDPFAFDTAEAEASSSGRFGQLNPADVPDTEVTNTFFLGEGTHRVEYDFNPFLAECKTPAFVKRIDSARAFRFMVYLKRGGTDDYYDDRYVVSGHGDVVHAQEVLDGTHDCG